MSDWMSFEGLGDIAPMLALVGVAHRGLPSRIAHGLAWRARLRRPRRMAALERELPMRAVARERAATVGPRSASVIPRVVHQTWVDDRFGRRHARALEAFRDLNPDFSFRLSTDADADDAMRRGWGDHPIADVYFRARYGPLKTDIWRYCTLFTEGGVYLDIGKALAAPLGRFVDGAAGGVVSFERHSHEPVGNAAGAARMLRPDGVLINWLMAFRPGHPVLAQVIDDIARDAEAYRDRVSVDPKHDILRLSGPLQLTSAFADVLARGEADDVRQVPPEFEDTTVWEVRGAWVRHVTRPPYILAKDARILD